MQKYDLTSGFIVTALVTLACAVTLGGCGVDRGGIVELPTVTGIGQTNALFTAGKVSRTGGGFAVAGADWDASTAVVQIDGAAAPLALIEDGEYVIVTGSNTPPMIASDVTVDRPVIGPVSSVDIAASTLTILGQRVVADEQTVYADPWDMAGLADITPGDDAVVSGVRRLDGTIVATRIAPNSNSLPALVTGPVSDLDASAGSFSLGGAAVSDGSLTLPVGFSGLVRVSAFTVNGNQLVDPVVQIVGNDPAPFTPLTQPQSVIPFSSQQRFDVRLEASIYSVPAPGDNVFNIGGALVVIDDNTVIVGGSQNDLLADQTVLVVGAQSPTRERIIASTVTLPGTSITAALGRAGEPMRFAH